MAPVPYPFEGVIRGRRSGAGVEKVVERRQRRMIKNRESAARSRARKQAYTMELEAEVQKLKEENEELQKKYVYTNNAIDNYKQLVLANYQRQILNLSLFLVPSLSMTMRKITTVNESERL
ncbi:hypothetical protein BDA96_08G047500 [Sorghum bicolor]|uniref:BZIP domain-containing protein n=1 Tax=Sorghum bicolor TaxID=4558 RepID=A0A921U618_SORBI|nr:hypothetical protein BDA96_08G047500 [Sorghum bicolor]